jgi:pentatricopeptide repeat protein
VCKRASDLNAALSFFEEAKSDGIQPNEFMYSSAIWTAASVKNSSCAQVLLDKMMKGEIVPNAICFDGGKLVLFYF